MSVNVTTEFTYKLSGFRDQGVAFNNVPTSFTIINGINISFNLPEKPSISVFKDSKTYWNDFCIAKYNDTKDMMKELNDGFELFAQARIFQEMIGPNPKWFMWMQHLSDYENVKTVAICGSMSYSRFIGGSVRWKGERE
ncbi:3490_t:CDS:2 [Gigaspora rosea]|nr:3490_t:CDS:2 [Gigaspora rosea]